MNTSFPVHVWAMEDPNTLQIRFIFLNTVLRSWIKGTTFLSNFYSLLFMFDLISQDQNNDEQLISCSYMNFGSSTKSNSFTEVIHSVMIMEQIYSILLMFQLWIIPTSSNSISFSKIDEHETTDRPNRVGIIYRSCQSINLWYINIL